MILLCRKGGIILFIRATKTTNKKTGVVYTKHQLVASIRTEKGPRQRTVMELGVLDVPKLDWKRLAYALECRITGQQSLLQESDAELERLALKLISNHELKKYLVEENNQPDAEKTT
jgi:hypothetical protein